MSDHPTSDMPEPGGSWGPSDDPDPLVPQPDDASLGSPGEAPDDPTHQPAEVDSGDYLPPGEPLGDQDAAP